MKYNQLYREQRYTIYCLLQKKLSKSKIAEIIGVHRSTVTRGLQRNTLKKISLISSAENKSARLITEKIRNALMHHKAKVKTITFDNETEFAAHKQIARKLDADICFAHPYSSWERGLNENINGLIRQYFPKGTSFKNINRSKLEKIMNELNHRPRKSLGFFTPYEVYYDKLFVALKT